MLRDKVRVAELADQQFGRISWAQLQEIGIPQGTIGGWLENGYLHRVLPHVYAVGHTAHTIEADLAGALLYAGPRAALSHTTAAWWLGLIDTPPAQIHVTTPRKRRSRRGIRVHDRTPRQRILHRLLPTTTIPQTLLDLAGTVSTRTLRMALANAEYHTALDLNAIARLNTRGSRGAAKLRQALEAHQPRLAFTKSRLEAMIVEICEEEGLPLPQINVKVAGWEVDAYWPEARLAVELDGYENHHTRAQLKRDRRKEMALRAAAVTPIRYSGEQLTQTRQEVAQELRAATKAATT